MNEKNIMQLLMGGHSVFGSKDLKDIANKSFDNKFLKEFNEFNMKP